MVDIFQEDLKELRDQIDAIDRSIIDLLGARKELTDKVVRFKSEQQARVFEPSIEETVLGWRRDYAQDKQKINPELAVDIFRLVMYDAYHLADITYQRVIKSNAIQNILILDKPGSYGGVLDGLFGKSGYDSTFVDHFDDLTSEQFSMADAVFIGTPIVPTLEALQKQNGLFPDKLIVLFGNLDANSMDALGNLHSGPTLGLQPMFSPAAETLTKDVIFICHGNLATRYLWLIDQIKMWGLIPVQASPADYDKLMLVMNSLNQLISITHASRLVDYNIDVDTLMKSVGPNYRLSLINLGRHFANKNTRNLSSLFEPKAENV